MFKRFVRAGVRKSVPSVRSRILLAWVPLSVGAGGLTWLGLRDQSSDLSLTRLGDLKRPVYGSSSDFRTAFLEIEKLIGSDNVSEDQSDLDFHSDTYYSTHHAKPDERPGLVAYADSTEHVSGILKICHKYRVPVVPFSGGTSIEGQYIPTRKGLTLDLSNMDEVVRFHPNDLDVTVQAGVGWQDLAVFLEPHSLLFGPDPGPGASIGGMIGNSCSGTNAYRYGTMKENVLSMTVVLADGSVVKTKNRPKKSSAGYNLNGLLIGSEGTLGIVTEATLKLHPKPKMEGIAVISFSQVEDAIKAVQEFIRFGVPLNAIELMNTEMIKCLNATSSLSEKLDMNPTLFLKIGGFNSRGMQDTIDQVRQISQANSEQHFSYSTTAAENEALWQARKVMFWSSIEYAKEKLGPNVLSWVTDLAVPISQLPEIVTETENDMEKNNIFGTILGHVGDGNFHALVFFTPDQTQDVKACVARMVKRGLDLGGTCTGEHGIGYGKRNFLVDEVGDNGISMMRSIKVALDPLLLLNPDKIFIIDPSDDVDH